MSYDENWDDRPSRTIARARLLAAALALVACALAATVWFGWHSRREIVSLGRNGPLLGPPRQGDELLLIGTVRPPRHGDDGDRLARAAEVHPDRRRGEPGNSGGPALTKNGRIVGVLVMGGAQNINFAVPVDRACAKLRAC